MNEWMLYQVESVHISIGLNAQAIPFILPRFTCNNTKHSKLSITEILMYRLTVETH